MDLSSLLKRKKGRRYPVKRDETGRSLRARCFERFAQGQRPQPVAQSLGMELTTACRYFRDWQHRGRNFEEQYAYIKKLFKINNPDRDKNLELFARTLGIGKEEFAELLSRPHGLKSLMTGKLDFPTQEEAAHKISVALELALVMADHLTKHRGKFADVYFAFQNWMKQNQAYREEEDEETIEQNKIIVLMRGIIKADLENEQRGRIQPQELSDQERDTIIKWQLQSEGKQIEMMYWRKIGMAMAEGLTREQAREKIYQDLLGKGETAQAKLMREYQDKVDPLKTGEKPPLPSPESPAAPEIIPG